MLWIKEGVEALIFLMTANSSVLELVWKLRVNTSTLMCVHQNVSFLFQNKVYTKFKKILIH